MRIGLRGMRAAAFACVLAVSEIASGLPQITTPAPGSPVTDPSISVSWSANGTVVARWWLFVGSRIGARDIHNSGNLGGSTSTTVVVPTDHRILYVRLWWDADNEPGGWRYVDVQYTSTMTPQLTSPPPGSLLTDPSISFSWSANGTPVERWGLFVGSSVGGSDIYDSGDLGGSTSTTVVVPTDARTLYVRLWWFLDGRWEWNDLQYTARMTPQITSPPSEIDVTDRIELNIDRTYYDRKNQQTYYWVSLTNTSNSVIRGPLRLAIRGHGLPEGVALDPALSPLDGNLDPALVARKAEEDPALVAYNAEEDPGYPSMEFDVTQLCPQNGGCKNTTNTKGPLVFDNPARKRFKLTLEDVVVDAGTEQESIVQESVASVLAVGVERQGTDAPPATVSAITGIYTANGQNNEALWENWPDSAWTNKPYYGDDTSGFTGLSWHRCTVPYQSENSANDTWRQQSSDPGRVLPEEVNIGLGGDNVYIWANYADLDLAIDSDQEVLTGIKVTHWPGWDCVSNGNCCPTGWEAAGGRSRDKPGGLTTGTVTSGCWKNGLCVRYEKLKDAKTIITNLSLSHSDDGDAAQDCPALCGDTTNDTYSVMRPDHLDIHTGCGDTTWVHVCYNEVAVSPPMLEGANGVLSADNLDVTDDEKYSLLRKYAPMVWIAQGEGWWPASVDWAFYDDNEDPRLLRSFIDGAYWVGTLTGLDFDGAHGSHWDVEHDRPVLLGQKPYEGTWGVDTSEFYTEAPVYAYWIEKTVPLGVDSTPGVVHCTSGACGKVVDLVYFFYYPFNRGNQVSAINYGNHVSDWEHVVVRLEWQWDNDIGGYPGRGWVLQPSTFYYGAHSFGTTRAWDDPEIQKHRGAATLAEEDSCDPGHEHFVENQCTHPVVYEAWGSHGLWAAPGDYVYHWTGLTDETSAGTRWVTPANLRAYEVDLVNLEVGFDPLVGAGNGWSLQGWGYPNWMSKDYDDDGVGSDPTLPDVGPIYRWGNGSHGCYYVWDSWQCVLEHGPTGPVDKGIMTSVKLK